MATPNYGYEKRQRELAKRQKKEEKLKAKAERKVGGRPDGTDDAQPADGGPPPSEAPGSAPAQS